jgi:hypothetical protein
MPAAINILVIVFLLHCFLSPAAANKVAANAAAASGLEEGGHQQQEKQQLDHGRPPLQRTARAKLLAILPRQPRLSKEWRQQVGHYYTYSTAIRRGKSRRKCLLLQNQMKAELMSLCHIVFGRFEIGRWLVHV